MEGDHGVVGVNDTFVAVTVDVHPRLLGDSAQFRSREERGAVDVNCRAIRITFFAYVATVVEPDWTVPRMTACESVTFSVGM